MTRTACVAFAVLVLTACGATPGGSAPDAGQAADSGSSGPRVEIGTRGDGAMFTPWTDEEIIPLVWGTQGGVMVTPAVAIDGMLVSATDPALVVELTNEDAETGAPIEGFASFGPLTSLFARLDRRLVNGPIFDQLGWSDMADRRIRIRAHVSGMGIDVRGEVVIVLGSAGAMPLTPG